MTSSYPANQDDAARSAYSEQTQGYAQQPTYPPSGYPQPAYPPLSC